MADPWMTEDQRYCYEMLCDWLRGAHHVPAVKPFGRGIKVSVWSSNLSTFDSDQLTRLVLLAHDRCVRVELANGGPGRTGVVLHRRRAREGCITQRHPTIEEALTLHRRHNRPAARAAELLQRQALVPVSVSERMPAMVTDGLRVAGDCDEQGRCWAGTRAFVDTRGDRDIDYPPSWELREVCAQDDVWLPAHALPLPEVNNG